MLYCKTKISTLLVISWKFTKFLNEFVIFPIYTKDVMVVTQTKNLYYSSGSSGRVKGGGEKHEIYVAAFGGHLFNDLFSQGRGGGMAPSASPDPLLIINTEKLFIVISLYIDLYPQGDRYLIQETASNRTLLRLSGTWKITVPVQSINTRQHSSRILTTHLPTVCILMATTRCQYQGG